MKSFTFLFAFVLFSAAAHAEEMTGEEVFNDNCSMCHGTIMSIAPRMGDKSAWTPRIKQGDDALVQHALHGYRQMPAKGGMNSLTDGEVKDAVHYMVSHSR